MDDLGLSTLTNDQLVEMARQVGRRLARDGGAVRRYSFSRPAQLIAATRTLMLPSR